MLNKYVKPGMEAQVLQGAAFLVKNNDGMLVLTSAFIICPCLSHSLFVYHRRQYTVLNTSGKLNFESESHFDADSVCSIASMTKLLIAVNVIQIAGKGKIGLDDDLGKAIPQLSNIEAPKGFDDDGKPIMENKTKPIILRESSRACLVISGLTKLRHLSYTFQRFCLRCCRPWPYKMGCCERPHGELYDAFP